MNRNPFNPSAGRPQVLLFNFRPDKRSMRIIRYLTETGVAVRQVPPEDFRKPLGALLSLPGYEASAPALPGPVFREELLLMCGFDDSAESRNSRPPLTTIHIHTQVMAFSAVQLLMTRIKEPSLDYRIVHTQTDLIRRESTTRE